MSTVPLVVTVQTLEVVEVKETAKPDEAVALTSKFASVALLFDNALKVIVCASGSGACAIQTAPLITTGKRLSETSSIAQFAPPALSRIETLLAIAPWLVVVI